jgi:hypothetical protein
MQSEYVTYHVECKSDSDKDLKILSDFTCKVGKIAISAAYVLNLKYCVDQACISENVMVMYDSKVIISSKLKGLPCAAKKKMISDYCSLMELDTFANYRKHRYEKRKNSSFLNELINTKLNFNLTEDDCNIDGLIIGAKVKKERTGGPSALIKDLVVLVNQKVGEDKIPEGNLREFTVYKEVDEYKVLRNRVSTLSRKKGTDRKAELEQTILKFEKAKETLDEANKKLECYTGFKDKIENAVSESLKELDERNSGELTRGDIEEELLQQNRSKILGQLAKKSQLLSQNYRNMMISFKKETSVFRKRRGGGSNFNRKKIEGRAETRMNKNLKIKETIHANAYMKAIKVAVDQIIIGKYYGTFNLGVKNNNRKLALKSILKTLNVGKMESGEDLEGIDFDSFKMLTLIYQGIDYDSQVAKSYLNLLKKDPRLYKHIKNIQVVAVKEVIQERYKYYIDEFK